MCPQFTVLLARTLPEWYGEHSLNRFSVPMLPNTQHQEDAQQRHETELVEQEGWYHGNAPVEDSGRGTL